MHVPPASPADSVAPTAEVTATDDVLLQRFAQTHDESAFAELVRRHGSLVMGTCMRTLDRLHEAEDAFQATFMVLARKAVGVRVAQSLAPWLYSTARRIAVRAAQQRQRRLETMMPADFVDRSDPLAEMEAKHRLHVLEEELDRLPAKLRDPLVLHYLSGKTNGEVAKALGITIRAVEGRQRRGKAALRNHLALRRISLPLAVAALTAAQQTIAVAVDPRLVQSTVAASLSFAAGEASTTCSPELHALAQKEVILMNASMPSTVIALAAVVLLGGVATIASQAGTAESASSGAALDLGADVVVAEGTAVPAEVAVSPASDSEVVPASAGGENPFAARVAANPTRTDASADPQSATGKRPEERLSLSWTYDRPSLSRKRLTQRELEIRTALNTPISQIQYAETPLNRVIEQVSDEVGVAIIFDRHALEDEALSPEIEVSVDLPQMQFRSAINLILREATRDLTYVVENEVLVITTRRRADALLETEIYDVLPVCEGVAISLADLRDVVLKGTDADSWQENGTGEGTISVVDGASLMIRQTQAVHAEIADLFEQMLRLVNSRNQ